MSDYEYMVTRINDGKRRNVFCPRVRDGSLPESMIEAISWMLDTRTGQAHDISDHGHPIITVHSTGRVRT